MLGGRVFVKSRWRSRHAKQHADEFQSSALGGFWMASQEAFSASLHETAVIESAWGGGVAPFATGTKKLGMWLFILSDALTFSALLVAYSYVRVASQNWPLPFDFYPSIVKATVMTFFLLT